MERRPGTIEVQAETPMPPPPSVAKPLTFLLVLFILHLIGVLRLVPGNPEMWPYSVAWPELRSVVALAVLLTSTIAWAQVQMRLWSQRKDRAWLASGTMLLASALAFLPAPIAGVSLLMLL